MSKFTGNLLGRLDGLGEDDFFLVEGLLFLFVVVDASELIDGDPAALSVDDAKGEEFRDRLMVVGVQQVGSRSVLLNGPNGEIPGITRTAIEDEVIDGGGREGEWGVGFSLGLFGGFQSSFGARGDLAVKPGIWNRASCGIVAAILSGGFGDAAFFRRIWREESAAPEGIGCWENA